MVGCEQPGGPVYSGGSPEFYVLGPVTFIGVYPDSVIVSPGWKLLNEIAPSLVSSVFVPNNFHVIPSLL